jgi:hypothetical protein
MTARKAAIEYAESIDGMYSREELIALYDLAEGLPDGARVVEIGVLYGRSASVLMGLSKSKGFDLRFVDPFVLQGKDAALGFAKLAAGMGVPFTLYRMKSMDVPWNANHRIDLLHVDGDHSPEGVKADCEWLQFVKSGGFAVFHDYGSRDYPQVKAVVDRTCSGWRMLRVGVTGEQARWMKR